MTKMNCTFGILSAFILESCEVDKNYFSVAQFIGHHLMRQEVSGSNPGQGTCSGGLMQEAANLMYYQNNVFLFSLSLSLKINKLLLKII